MQDLSSALAGEFSKARFVLTDMDDTLTFDGRLSARTYTALERLQSAGLKVIIVTAAPAGWCDQMARMWPVDGVIGENGGLFFQRNEAGVLRDYWHGDTKRRDVAARLSEIGQTICANDPSAQQADDQPFRLTSLALRRPDGEKAAQALSTALSDAGLSVAQNNLWVLGWIGDYDKLSMARRVLSYYYATDIDRENEAVCYCGDSENDTPMFRFFLHSIGMSTVLHQPLSCKPRWITRGPGGDGFVVATAAILAGR